MFSLTTPKLLAHLNSYICVGIQCKVPYLELLIFVSVPLPPSTTCCSVTPLALIHFCSTIKALLVIYLRQKGPLFQEYSVVLRLCSLFIYLKIALLAKASGRPQGILPDTSVLCHSSWFWRLLAVFCQKWIDQITCYVYRSIQPKQ